MSKEYLGDGVSADFDQDQVILTAEDGEGIISTIYLDARTRDELLRYIGRCEFKKQGREQALADENAGEDQPCD